MRGKLIALTEGKNDTFFLSELYKQIGMEESKISKKNLHEEAKIEENKNEETKLIKKFIEKSSPYHILLKSEGGIDKVFQMYSAIFESVPDDVKIMLLFDLDSLKLDERLNALKNKLNCRKGRRLKLKRRVTHQEEVFTTAKGKITIDKEEISVFYMVCFNKNLEAEFEIGKKANEKTKEKRIREMMSEKEFIESMKEKIQQICPEFS